MDLKKYEKKLARFVAIDREVAVLRKERDAIRDEILDAMGEERNGESKSFVVTRGTQPRKKFETTLFREENPGIYEKYVREAQAEFFKVKEKE